MAKQMQLFPAEQRQEDIINAPADAASLEGFPLNTSAEPVLDMNNIAEVDTDIVEETAVYPIKKEPIIFEPYDVANMNKLGIYGKELLEVFNLVQEEVAKKARDKAEKPARKAPPDSKSSPDLQKAQEELDALQKEIQGQKEEPDLSAAMDSYIPLLDASDTQVDTMLKNLRDPRRSELSSKDLTDFSAVNKEGKPLIPDEDGVRAVIESQSQIYKAEITDATRDVVTQQAQRDLADLIGTDPEKLTSAVLGRKLGGVIQVEGMGLAETMLAARDLLVTEAGKLDVLGKQITALKNEGKTDTALLLAFKKQMVLVGNLGRQVKGSQTEMARAMGGLNIAARQGEGVDLRAMDVGDLLEEYGGEQHILDIVDKYQRLRPHQRMKFTRDASKFKRGANALYEAWINALLSSPVTHFKNTVGTLLTTINHLGTLSVAATATSVRRAAGYGRLQPADEIDWGDVRASLFAAQISMGDAWSGAFQAYRGEPPIGGSKIDYQKMRQRAFSAEALQIEGNVLATTVDVIGSVVTLGRIPTNMLQFEDAFFKTIANNMELYRLAYKEAVRQNKNTDVKEMAGFIADYVYNPPKTHTQQAETLAKYVTLQSDLGTYGKIGQRAARMPGLRWFVPFFKTPLNAIKYVGDHTPIGIWFGDTHKMLQKGGADADVARARIAVGSTASLVAMSFAIGGLVTGGGPENPSLRNARRRNGWQPYSIKVGNTYYSLAGLEPFSSVLMLIGDASDLITAGHASDREVGEMITAVIAAVGYSMTNKTMMQGFANLMDALRDPDRYAGSTLDQFSRSIVPSGIAKINSSYMDPVFRQAEGIIEQIKSRTPGLSKTLPPRRDLWGRVKLGGGALGPDIVSPVYTSVYKDDPLDNEIWDLRARISNHPDELQFDEAPPDTPITLGPESRDFFHRRAGEISYQELTKMIVKKSARWNKDKERNGRDWAIEEIRKVIRLARDEAEYELLRHPDFGPDLKRLFKELHRRNRR